MLKWNDVKDYIQVRFINKEENQHFLENLPSKDILNLTVVFFIEMVAKEREPNYITINNSMLKELGQDLDGLLEQALANMSMKDMCLFSMDEASGISEKSVDDMRMYVLTNRTKTFGTTCILLKEVRRKIISFFGESVYVIPSSCHELILAPVSKMEFSADELCKIVKEINRTLHPMDVLSDSIYLINGDAELSVVA